MAYNPGMNQLTFVLPYALPAAELAPDIIKALQAPALAALLSRTSSQQFHRADNASHLLPHEAWLASALTKGAGLAAQAMRGFGLSPEPGARYFLIHPVNIELARTHIGMGDARQLQLSEADSRALFETARPFFDEMGQPLYYGDALTWFMRADAWSDLQGPSPDAAATQDLSVAMPEGEHARPLRRLQNEIQMLWHGHPANAAREERGLKPVNSFWLWGGALASDLPDQAQLLHTLEAPGWLAALAEPAQRNATLTTVLAGKRDALLVHGGLIAPALAQEWGLWLQQMQQLEQHWFAPLLSALKDGSLGQLRLILTHREGWHDSSTSKSAQRKFWRTNNLNALKQP